MKVKAPFHIMTKPSGSACNIRCDYCFYLEKEKLFANVKKQRMDEATLELYIRSYIEAQPTDWVSFAWQGGEPTLLGVSYFEKVVELQKKYANGKKIENAFQTNGTLIDDAWAEFFVKNQFLVGVSIDGPKHIHNEYRKNASQEGTFDKVVRGIQYLQKHKVEFNTLTCLNRLSAKHPLDIYRFLKKLGVQYMQFIPIVERQSDQCSREWGLSLSSPSYESDNLERNSMTDWSVNPEDFGRFYITLFNYWVKNDVGRVFVQFFDTTFGKWMGQPGGLCVQSETCGAALALEHDGSVYSCDHFVYPNFKLGNIKEEPLADIVTKEKQVAFGNNKRDLLPRRCLDCKVLFACNGGCPKHRFIETEESGKWLNYLCRGYKMFFNHCAPYMSIMAKLIRSQRAPAEIMQWLESPEGKSFLKQQNSK